MHTQLLGVHHGRSTAVHVLGVFSQGAALHRYHEQHTSTAPIAIATVALYFHSSMHLHRVSSARGLNCAGVPLSVQRGGR